MQIAGGMSVADGDNGNTVFNQIKTGNGTFTVSSPSSNTGGGLVGATSVTDLAAYDQGTYDIKFTSPTAYSVVNTATNATVTSGTYTDGQAITFAGLQVNLSGAPAAGDFYTVAPSTNQSIFATVQNLVTALSSKTNVPGGTATPNNNIAAGLNNIDQTLDHISTIRSTIGGRLNSLTALLSVSGNTQVQLQTSISNLQSLDYASALTTLPQQQTTLSAAMQSYTLMQGLSLFKFLSG